MIKYILLMFMASFVFGQTVVNTEKLATLGSNAIELNFDFEEGNSSLNQLDAKTIFICKLGDYQRIKFLSGVEYLSEDHVELTNRYFIHMRHNYLITRSIRTFTFYQLQSNNDLLLKGRQLVGSGIRKVFHIDSHLFMDYPMHRLSILYIINLM